MRRAADVARGVLAFAVLIVVLAGLPTLLVTAVGWPLPRAVPRIADLADTFTGDQPLETVTVWKVLAVALWVAWAQVLAAAAVETVAIIRGGLPRPLPGLGLGHGLAGPLIAAIVLAWPTGTPPGAGARPVPATAAAAHPPPPQVAVALPEPEAPDPPPSVAEEAVPVGVDHVVQRRDTLWDLAERYLGDGYRATELFDLNRGRPQPDGRSLSDPGLLRPGWVLRIPIPDPAPPAAVTVRPGDTLWDLAVTHLGDGHRSREIADLNIGRPQPDGRTLVDPDLIEPGWVLHLPTDAPAGAASPADTPAPPTDPAAPPEPPEPPEPPPEDGWRAGSPATTSSAPPTSPASQSAPAPAGAQPHATTAPAESGPDVPDESGEPESEGDDEPVPVAPIGLIGGGLATAGLLALLDRRRRAQHRHRQPGHRLPTAPLPVAEAERALRAGADVDAAASVDAALRAAATGNGSLGLPRLSWAEVTADAVTLVVDTDTVAPVGFVDAGSHRWQATAGLDELVGLGETAASPAPTLVPMGSTDDGTEILVDLESTAVTTIGGDPAAVDELLRATAVAAATAPWRDQARVVLVGMDAAALPVPGIEVGDNLDDALDQLEQRSDAITAALDSVGCATIAQARAVGVTPDAWEPLVVIAATPPHERQLRRLAPLVDRPAHGVAAVVRASPSTAPLGRMLTVDADGGLTISDLDLTLRACQLDTTELRLVGDLLDHTRLGGVPADQVEDPPPRTAPSGATPPTVDTALDALLVDVDVMVRILGEVHAVRSGPGGEEPVTVAKQKSLEAIAYLALREDPVDREDLQAALWPAGTNSAKTFHNTIWAARKALGADRDGADLLPDPVEGRYILGGRAVTDYGLFHELVARADQLDDAGTAAALLAEALTLIGGEPFLGVGRGYAWVAPHAGIIVAQVVDAAEELAEVRLAAGDWRGAEWAARQGLRVFPCEERLYRLLMRCAHTAGTIGGVHRAFAELTAALADPDEGVEPEDTVHPETVALLEQLTGGTRSGRASA